MMITRRTGVRTTDVDGELILLDLVGDKVHKLNKTAAFAWDQLEQGMTAEQIAARISQVADVSKSQALADLKTLITQLRECQLLVDSEQDLGAAKEVNPDMANLKG